MNIYLKVNKLSFDSYVKFGKTIGIFNGLILGILFFIFSFFISKQDFFSFVDKIFLNSFHIDIVEKIQNLSFMGIAIGTNFQVWYLGLVGLIVFPILVGFIMMLLSILSYPLYLLCTKFFKIIIKGDFDTL